MNPDEIESIKKNYIFKHSQNIKDELTDINDNINNNIDIIRIIEQLIKTKYPEYWKNYETGKLFSKSSIYKNFDGFLTIFLNTIKENFEQKINNSSYDIESKKIIIEMYNNQIECIKKLNNPQKNINLLPVFLCLIGFLLNIICS